jgi:hypothetical protein
LDKNGISGDCYEISGFSHFSKSKNAFILEKSGENFWSMYIRIDNFKYYLVNRARLRNVVNYFYCILINCDNPFNYIGESNFYLLQDDKENFKICRNKIKSLLLFNAKLYNEIDKETG